MGVDAFGGRNGGGSGALEPSRRSAGGACATASSATGAGRPLLLSRRAGLAGLLAGLVAGRAVLAAPAGAGCSWPLWQTFKEQLVQPDGRVLDASTPQKHSSSEGQSYAMFLALVAGDREVFDRAWRWAVDNLLGGRVEGRLPAWFWGLAPDGSWRVLDDNSASDADLWIAYALLEAARLWKVPAYERDARLLLAEIERREVVDVPGLGPMLLPGERGFVHADPRRPGVRIWHFNPSYLPVQVLRRLAVAAPRGPWGRMVGGTLALLRLATAPSGFAPDWVAYTVDAEGRAAVEPHPAKGDAGSYDAIRTYLWAGMLPRSDAAAAEMRALVRGLPSQTAATGVPAESVSVATGKVAGTGPFGFSAALLPYFDAAGDAASLARQRTRVADGLQQVLAAEATALRQPPYYDIVLTLFGLGWLEGRYRFTRNGALEPAWKTSPCRAATSLR